MAGLWCQRHSNRQIVVTQDCLSALPHGRSPSIIFFSGIPQRVVTTDVALTGWDTVHEGRVVNGLWSPQLRHAHTLPRTADIASCLDALSTLPSKLSHPSQDRPYDCGGIHQPPGWHSLSALTQTILWSSASPSLCATHFPGIPNVRADLLSRGNPRYGDWRLLPQVVLQICESV